MSNFQYIKDALDEQNKSISWLAKEIGVSKGYVSKLLNNKVAEPGSAKIMAIHQALGILEQPTKYEKNALLINVESLSVEKYIYVASECIKTNYDIFVLISSKYAIKQINLRRFYDYVNFSNSKVYLVNEAELRKALSKSKYNHIVGFNDEFNFLKNTSISNVEISDYNVLQLRNIKNKAILVIGNNQAKVSILLNVLKLQTNYLVDDFAIFKDVNKNGNTLISNQLSILEKIHRSCQSSRFYIVGNEYVFFENDSDLSLEKNGIVNIREYFELFDQIYVINFKEVDDFSKQLHLKNNKLVKVARSKSYLIENDDILEIANEIKNKMEGIKNEN